MKTRIRIWLARLYDFLFSPFIALASLILFIVRRLGVEHAPVSKRIFRWIGVFPVIDHYYEPLFNTHRLRTPLDADRHLPALDLNVSEQLAFLARFDFVKELEQFPLEDAGTGGFYYHNPMFNAGDAEYFYSVIRLIKPARIIEIGSGHSTLLALAATQKNREEDPAYRCEHISIEPYERPWLEQTSATIVRTRVEETNIGLFKTLSRNDILFIDSSHIIRPQGDVLFEYLEILPVLNPGVMVHIHDIYTPRDYPARVIAERIHFWNEQYLLEGFLSCNNAYKVIGALNYLRYHHTDRLAEKCPVFKSELPSSDPGSFWIVKTG